jgi:DNA (cytosine-5)-methyltransferase 1
MTSSSEKVVIGPNQDSWAARLRELAGTRQYRFVESFSGPGGLGLGLKWAGLDCVFAFDYNEKAVQTHCHNLGDHCVVADASQVSGDEICQGLGIVPGDLEVFCGGPPCQGFSKQRRGAHRGDSRNDLVLEYLRLVEELHPRFFIFENVAIFGQKRGQKYIDEMLRRLTDYDLFPSFYNAADYGLCQTRQRYILVGRRRDQKSTFRTPRPTVTTWRTVGQVLEGLPEPPEDYTEHADYPNHQRARVTAINIERFSHVPQGGSWLDIPYELRLKCHQRADTRSGGWPDVYGRLEWNGQCPTITGGFDSYTRGRYGHPLHDRPLTPREAARIQGFSDDFVFLGNRGDVRSQIGNAVPPPLAEAVGLEVVRSMLCADGLIDDECKRSAVRIQPLLL